MEHTEDTKRLSGSPRWTIDRRRALQLTGGSVTATVLGSAWALDAAAQETDAEQGYQFFTTHQFETVEAIAEQYWPTTEASPGGRDAGAAYYIDRALAGAYMDYRDIYKAGLDWLDTASELNGGAEFVDLEAAQQTALLTAIFDETLVLATAGPGATPEAVAAETGPEPEGAATPVVPAATPLAPEVDEAGASEGTGVTIVAGLEGSYVASLLDFMNVVRIHTMEGLFADPVHGGNRDFAGWRAVGYPGPYVYYGEEEQQSFEPLNQPLQSVADL